MSGFLQRLVEVQQTTSALPAADTDSDEDRAGLRGSWSRSTCLRLALRHQAFQLRGHSVGDDPRVRLGLQCLAS
jgi:hypothetical protein